MIVLLVAAASLCSGAERTASPYQSIQQPVNQAIHTSSHIEDKFITRSAYRFGRTDNDDDSQYKYSRISTHSTELWPRDVISDGDHMIWSLDRYGTFLQGVNTNDDTSILFDTRNTLPYNEVSGSVKTIAATNPQTNNSVIFMTYNNVTAVIDAFTGQLYRMIYVTGTKIRVNADGSRLAVQSVGSIGVYEMNYSLSASQTTNQTSTEFVNPSLLFSIAVADEDSFTISPSGHLYVVAKHDNNVREYDEHGRIMTSHIVEVADFDVYDIAVDALGTIAMMSYNPNQVYFQSTVSGIRTSPIFNSSELRSWDPPKVTSFGHSEFAFTNMALPCRSRWCHELFTLSHSTWSPFSSSAPRPMPTSSNVDYIFVEEILPGTFWNAVMSKDPSQPNRLYMWRSSIWDNLIQSFDIVTQSTYPSIFPSTTTLYRCGVNDTPLLLRLVPLRSSLMILASDGQLARFILQINTTTGDCMRSWSLPSVTFDLEIGLFDVDESTDRLVVSLPGGLNNPISRLLLLSIETGTVLASTEIWWKHNSKAQFDPRSSDIFISENREDLVVTVYRLDGWDLSIPPNSNHSAVVIQGQNWAYDHFGNLLVSDSFGNRFTYIYPNGSVHIMPTPLNSVFVTGFTFTLDHDVIAVAPYMFYRYRPNVLPSLSSSTVSLSSTGVSSSSQSPSSSMIVASSTTAPASSIGTSSFGPSSGSGVSSSTSSLSSTDSMSSASLQSSSGVDDSNAEGDHASTATLSSGTIAGIVIGIVVAVILFLLSLFICWRYPPANSRLFIRTFKNRLIGSAEVSDADEVQEMTTVFHKL